MTIWLGSVLAGAVLAFVVGALWYGLLFGGAAASLSPAYAEAATPQASTVAFEALRCLGVAAGLAILIRWTGIDSLSHALLLAFLVWAGFQAAGLAGAVVHEGYPAKLYAIHTGDALVKAVVVSLFITFLTTRFG
ncbi:DUF1761 domain-containing protein [Oceaniovalibus sp. ACAM 378]|uniref:DUF1761 domain-containing protein n=1 Tax=Oceaniovalibus sp. ACAM 378 TaxID=2599923 RepID=UPI0011D4B76E|nr:DUF1761 domain-containing protein [Oceaniovalibus sp. ACAM 378]TYB86064.1 DUF1761 domain-containing protein [Oceaniovalibus sp. ACAM 378]